MSRPPLHLITYPKINPSSESGELSVTIKIPYAHLNYAYTITLSKSLYESAKASSKSAMVPAKTGDAWLFGYYHAFIFDPLLSNFYTELLRPFRKIRSEAALDSDRYLELLTAYVQGLPYDTEKLASIEIAPRFPIETVVDGTGICSDKSLLLASMLSHEGYAVALLHFGKENHLAVGIKAPDGFDFKKTGYAVIETTCVSYIGSEPCIDTPSNRESKSRESKSRESGSRESENHESKNCDSEAKSCKSITRPKVIPIGNGTKTYDAIRDTVKIIAVIRSLEEKLNPNGTLVFELKRLKDSIEKQTLSLRDVKSTLETDVSLMADSSKYDSLQKTYRTKLTRLQHTIHQYNSLANEFSHAQEMAAFLRSNRLDRQAVMKRLRQGGLGEVNASIK